MKTTVSHVKRIAYQQMKLVACLWKYCSGPADELCLEWLATAMPLWVFSMHLVIGMNAIL